VNGAIVRGSVTLADGDEVEAGVLRLIFRTRSYGSTETAKLPRSAVLETKS